MFKEWSSDIPRSSLTNLRNDSKVSPIIGSHKLDFAGQFLSL